MMIQSLRGRPLVFKLLLGLFVLVAMQLLFMFISSFHHSPNILRAAVQLVLWLTLCTGFYFLKKWAWAALFVLLLFSGLNIIYALLSSSMSFRIASLLSVMVAGLAMWALNTKSVSELFHIEQRKIGTVPFSLAAFSLICLTCSLFIVVELFGLNRMAIYSIAGRLFTGFMAFVFVLLGIGSWQSKKIAIQATPSILIFTLLITTFMLLYDLYTRQRTLALPNLIFYISCSLFMLIFWIKGVMPKIEKEDL